ncbi:hypothetical protein [Bacillus sp. 2205SS5-2]|uniref:hypothetical protein n=1 Tax=Bacillus sp. 2205SS5-2 TaxID=3109031 RepID=UPI0030064A34
MKINNGVTNFYKSKANKPPKVDGKQFKQLWFDTAYCIGGKVIEVKRTEYQLIREV